MTSPPERITIKCPSCGGSFEDWHRPSINLMLDNFDKEYLRKATIKTCPHCKTEIRLNTLIVGEDGVFKFGPVEDEGLKVIFSRKGFDSASGGVPSPIFPDGRMCYLPIPNAGERLTYSRLSWDGQHLGDIVEQVTGGNILGNSPVHLDPDIDREAIRRSPGWKGLFGQADKAESHLQKQGIGMGDLFLFFGWYRAVEVIRGRITYVSDAPHMHVLFGWLQVGSVWRSDEIPKAAHSRARYHPHFGRDGRLDSIYVASRKLDLTGLKRIVPGAGVFGRFAPMLCLTAPDSLRSRWRLPAWFHPAGRDSTLSYHDDLARWQRGRNCTYLNTVGRGQEFVLDCDHYPESAGWLRDLFAWANA